MRIRIEIVAAAIIILCTVFGITKCQSDRAYRDQAATIDSLVLANQQLITKLNKAGDTIHTQTAIVTSSQEQIKSLTDSIFNLRRKDERKVKEVIAYWRERTSTRVDSFETSWVDTLAMRRFKDSVESRCKDVISYMRDSTISVPRTSRGDSLQFSYDVTVVRKGLVFNRIEFADSLDSRFVESGGFLKKRSIEVQFKHSNPNVKVVGSNSVYYKPRYRGRWAERVILALVGVFVGLKL
jgi:hypothetical protein